MNMTPLMNKLQEKVGYPIEMDEYEGTDSKYMVYTYEDERSVLYGDNRPLCDTQYLQIRLYTPKNYNYYQDKNTIRDTLIEMGFIITGIRTWLENVIDNKGKKIRCTVFNAEYTCAH